MSSGYEISEVTVLLFVTCVGFVRIIMLLIVYMHTKLLGLLRREV